MKSQTSQYGGYLISTVLYHNETLNIRHFTQFLYDVSPLFSKAGPQGELEEEAGSRLRAAPSNNNAFPTLSQSVKI